MEPPKKHKSSVVPVKEEVELEDQNDLLVKRRRTEFSGPIIQLKQDFDTFAMENKVPGKEPMDVLTSSAVQNSGRVNGYSTELKQEFEIFDMENKVPGKEPMDVLTSSAAQNSDQANGFSTELKQEFELFAIENKVPGKEPMDVLTSSAVQNSGQANGCSKESASTRLPKICKVIGWKEPQFDFEEQGPPHNKVFTCKVTFHLSGFVNTVMECFSDPKPGKKAAKEHAAQGALWLLQRSGYVK